MDWHNAYTVLITCGLLCGEDISNDAPIQPLELQVDTETLPGFFDPKIISLDNECLQTYVDNKNVANELKVTNIERVTTTQEASADKIKQITGGQTVQDPTKPHYKELAEKSLKQYIQEKNLSCRLNVTKIVNVTTQVVSGIITRLHFVATGDTKCDHIKCFSRVWEQEWLNKTEIYVSCIPLYDLCEEKIADRVSQQDQQDEQDRTNSYYKDLAQQSLKQYIVEKKITDPLNVTKVENATTQVVSETLTTLYFDASGDLLNEKIKCLSEIREQHWLDEKQIKISCTSHQSSEKEMPSGEVPQDFVDPKYQSMAEESLKTYMIDNKITDLLKVFKVKNVTIHLVSRRLTMIYFEASSDLVCNKQKCISKIWEQDHRHINVSCTPSHEICESEQSSISKSGSISRLHFYKLFGYAFFETYAIELVNVPKVKEEGNIRDVIEAPLLFVVSENYS